MLLKALGAFFILIYIHVAFSQTPATCLEHIKNEWPRDGILRVEILRQSQYVNPTIHKIFDDNDASILIQNNHKNGIISIDPSTTLPHEQDISTLQTARNENDVNYDVEGNLITTTSTVTTSSTSTSSTQENDIQTQNDSQFQSTEYIQSYGDVPHMETTTFDGLNYTKILSEDYIVYGNETTGQHQDTKKKYDFEGETNLKSDVTEVEKLINAG